MIAAHAKETQLRCEHRPLQNSIYLSEVGRDLCGFVSGDLGAFSFTI